MMWPMEQAEYRVPQPLARVRELRHAAGGSPIATDDLAANVLWAMCEEELPNVGAFPLRVLYNHAFIEAGWIGESPEPAFRPFMICPICGYVFG